jgi:hypothetical protein
MISWSDVPSINNARKCMAYLRKNVITPENYGFGKGNWNLTDLIKDTDQRARVCMMILHACLPDGQGPTQGYEFVDVDGNVFRFKFQVLTRQACKEDAEGSRIWNNEHGKEMAGSANDIVVAWDIKPRPGDVVTFKQAPLLVDENGEPIKSDARMDLASQGKPIHLMRRFVVDDDLCISLPNPFAQMGLEHHGYKLLKPEFHRGYRQRGITNWWFREVPRNFRTKRNESTEGEVPELTLGRGKK